jgi:uncharacterized repeat protein (TIGR01451 family)
MEIQLFNYGQLKASAGRVFILLLSLIIIFNPPLATLSPVGETQIHSSLPSLLILSQHPPLAGSSQPAETNTTVEGVSQDWWSATQQNIRQAEYNLTWQAETYLVDLPAAYQAPNRAHNLRTYFTPEGIRVVPRVTENSPDWEWNLNLIGYGYADNIQAVSPATLTPNENRVDYHRGALTEWYLNAEKGLEQGFTLETPPAANRASATNLVFEFSLSGNLKPSLAADGQTLDFFTQGGVRVLRYSNLYVTDAQGRSLPAHLSLSTATKKVLHITVDTTSAVYPITIDSLTTTPLWGATGDQTGALFGYSVGTAGDVNGDGYADVIVGAYGYDNGQADEGRAYVYYGSAFGLDTAPAWTAESNQSSAILGVAVGTAGDVNGDSYSDVIVGAQDYSNGQSQEGAAFLWYGSNTGLGANGTPANADWLAESNQPSAKFGGAVGTAGDVDNNGYDDVIIGAYYYTNGQGQEGGAFAWYSSLTGLGANGTPSNADWATESNITDGELGTSAGTAGDVNGDNYADVIVGASYFSIAGGGQAYVFHGSGTGLSSSADWTAQSGQSANSGFGVGVGTAGDVNGDGYSDVIVGAPSYDNGQTDEGAAFVWYGSNTGLGADGTAANADWTAEGDQDTANFGMVVGTAGDVNGDGYAEVLVGADWYDNGESNEGRVYGYHGSDSGLSLTPNWIAEGNQTDAWFGNSVGTAGDVNGDGYTDVIVGAWFYDEGESEEGLALVWYGSALGLGGYADWTGESDQSGAGLGISVSTAGDVNGDGYSDVILGAANYDNGQADEGAAFVWQGSASGLGAPGTPANAVWMAEGNQASAQLGGSVSTAGDVNGDGYSDVIVGAYTYDNGQADEGRVFVWHGSASGLGADGTPANADWSAESNQASARFGVSVSTAGDVNGDGYSDVIVGAYLYDNIEGDEGMAFVWHGSATGLGAVGTPANADWLAESNQINAQFGISVSTAGDVNGDDYADVIIGAYIYDNGQTDEGMTFLWYGSATGLGANGTPANMDWKAESNQVSAGLGVSAITAGDVNGDGYADVIIGAIFYDNGETDEGMAFVWYGSASGLGTNGTPANADWKAESDQDGAYLGASVSTAGDVNGDGYADILIGSVYYDNDETDEGAAFVWYGSAIGLGANGNPTNPVWFLESNQVGAWLGISVTTAGDVNGDGYADLLLGASHYDSGQVDEGFAFLYYGTAGSASLSPNWVTESNQTNAYYGTSVGTAGDVNGDGYADVIIGALYYDNGENDEGRAYLYYGSATGLSSTPAWTAESNQNGGQLGVAVGTAGDVNGDGYADVIVGAHFYDNGQTDEGAAFVWYGSATGLGANGTPLNADWTDDSDQASSQYGFTVGTAGDVNGDGYADVLTTAWYYTNGQFQEGKAYVYHGSASGLNTTPNWMAESNANDALFGVSSGTAGDVNGDGYSDIIIGADFYGPGGGQAYVYHGSASGLSTSPDWNVQTDQGNSLFGNWVSTAGDVNGDGYADVVVSAVRYSNGESMEGRVYLYHGSSSGLNLIPDWVVEGGQVFAELGIPATTAGDVNGDGYADVLIIARSYDNGETDEGLAYLYHGSASGLNLAPSWITESNLEGASFGNSAAGTAGDVNGDGYADIIIGGRLHDNGQGDEGLVFVYHGNSGAGLSLNPRQRRGDDMAPVAHLGDSYNTAFHLRLLGRTPFGRGRVKLQWEVKPLGILFDGTGIQQTASWMNTGVAGVQLNALVNNLTSNTAYHWRVRLHYHSASTPFQQYSRWLTTPWNGWNETRLQTGDPGADLSISKSDGQTIVTPGNPITYTIVISNPSPIVVPNAVVTDTFPATLVGVTWTCSASAGSSCTASGSGSISQTVMLAAGGSVTFTASSTLTTTASGTLSNTAYVVSPLEANDPNSSNNSATDTDTISGGCTPLVPPLIYANTFGGSVGSEWSNTSTDLTPTSRPFLGQFGNQTVSLTLSCLPAHTHVGVSFDLFVIRSWDGNLSSGPDIWELNVTGGTRLSHTTFANWNVKRQAYPGTYPSGDYVDHTGATEINTLGYTYSNSPMDAVYHLNYLFSHASASLALNFLASGLQALVDESWGIDNIEVTVKTFPYNVYVPSAQK